MKIGIPHWAHALSVAVSTQMLAQGLGMITGLILVRVLPVQEYAVYTIALAGLATMTVLTDGGLGFGVLNQGGRAWRDRRALGAVVVTALDLRRRVSVAVLILGLPCLALLLRSHGQPVSYALILCAVVVVPFLTNLTNSILGSVPQLHQALLPVRRLQLEMNAARLVVIGLGTIFLPYAAFALLVTGLTQLWQNRGLRKVASEYADLDVPVDGPIRGELVRQLQRTYPEATYTAFSGQITVFLATLLGATQSVADLGALSRLGILVTLIGATFGAVAIPRFARLPTGSALVGAWFLKLQLALVFLGASFALALFLFRELLVSLLGPGYRGLEHEVILTGVSAALALLAQQTFTLGAVRGIVPRQSIAIPVNLAVQVLLMFTLRVDTLQGVLWLGIGMFTTQWIVNLAGFLLLHGRDTESASKAAERLRDPAPSAGSDP